MAAAKKKRNKPYRGPDARSSRPAIVRVQAVKRSRPKQWYVDHKERIKPLLKIGLVVLIVVVCVVGLIELFTQR